VPSSPAVLDLVKDFERGLRRRLSFIQPPESVWKLATVSLRLGGLGLAFPVRFSPPSANLISVADLAHQLGATPWVLEQQTLRAKLLHEQQLGAPITKIMLYVFQITEGKRGKRVREGEGGIRKESGRG